MKTAEEIFNEIPFLDRNGDYFNMPKTKILEAMNEYAAQFIHPKDCYQCDGTGTVIFPSKATQQCMICNGTGKLIILPMEQNT